MDGAGIVCNEWSVDSNETQLDEMVAGWAETCAGQGGAWAVQHCDTAGAVGVCVDETVAKVITVFYAASGLTVEEIEQSCSGTCQTFYVP